VNTSFEQQLIQKVLDSADAARMRDLPAYFLCSTSLQKAIKKYLDRTAAVSVPLRLREMLLV